MQVSLAKFTHTQTLTHAIHTLESYPRVHKDHGPTLPITESQNC